MKDTTKAKDYITKQCQTLKQAERHQNTLYDLFDYVRLINWPSIGESGQYTWQIRIASARKAGRANKGVKKTKHADAQAESARIGN